MEEKGTEGKPYQPNTSQQVINSEKGFGEFTIMPGATLTNNGSLVVYGRLYNLGTIVNDGYIYEWDTPSPAAPAHVAEAKTVFGRLATKLPATADAASAVSIG